MSVHPVNLPLPLLPRLSLQFRPLHHRVLEHHTCPQMIPSVCMHLCTCFRMYVCIYACAYCIVLNLSISIALLTARAFQKHSSPQQLTLCRSLHAEALQVTVSQGLAQGPYKAARAGFEPTTLQSQGIDSTNVPPTPHDLIYDGRSLLLSEMNLVSSVLYVSSVLLLSSPTLLSTLLPLS